MYSSMSQPCSPGTCGRNNAELTSVRPRYLLTMMPSVPSLILETRSPGSVYSIRSGTVSRETSNTHLSASLLVRRGKRGSEQTPRAARVRAVAMSKGGAGYPMHPLSMREGSSFTVTNAPDLRLENEVGSGTSSSLPSVSASVTARAALTSAVPSSSVIIPSSPWP